MTKKKTTEEYTRELYEVNPFVVPLTPYIDAHTFSPISTANHWKLAKVISVITIYCEKQIEYAKNLSCQSTTIRCSVMLVLTS